MRTRFVLFVTLFVFVLLAALSYPRSANALQGEFLRIWLNTSQCFGEEVAEYPFNGLIDMAIRSQTWAAFQAELYVDGIPFEGSTNLCVGTVGNDPECSDSGSIMWSSLDRGYSLFEYSIETDPAISGNVSLTMKMSLEGGCPNGPDDPYCREYEASTVLVATSDYCIQPWTPTPSLTVTPTRWPSKTTIPTETVMETPTSSPTVTLTPTLTPTFTPDRKYRIWYFPLVFK